MVAHGALSLLGLNQKKDIVLFTNISFINSMKDLMKSLQILQRSFETIQGGAGFILLNLII